MRRSVSLVAAGILLLASTATASAAKPIGACPQPFDAATLAELTGEYPLLIEVFGEQAITDLFNTVDGNGNGTLCWAPHPTHSTSYTTKTFLVNLVDDVRAARG